MKPRTQNKPLTKKYTIAIRSGKIMVVEMDGGKQDA